MKSRQLLLVTGLLTLAGCNATSNSTTPVDYGDELETPDLILQDISNKTVRHGDPDFTLAADAKQRDQQVKPDPLIQGISRSELATVPVKPRVATKVAPAVQVPAQPRLVEKTAVAESAPVQAKSAGKELERVAEKVEDVIKSVTLKPEVTSDDRELEMPDPLLGEVDPD